MKIDTAPNRVAVVEANLDRFLAGAPPAPSLLGPDAPLRPGSTLTAQRAVELFEDQYTSRMLDRSASSLTPAAAHWISPRKNAQSGVSRRTFHSSSQTSCASHSRPAAQSSKPSRNHRRP